MHITFRDINEKYKEESIHQHCMKNEHPHTKTKQTLFISLEPLVSYANDFVCLLLFPRYKGSKLDRNSIFPKSPLFQCIPYIIFCLGSILGTVTDRQNHLHITFRDINEKYKEESIHQHCMKNEHNETSEFLKFYFIY
jgi:hypothetical protein